MWTIKQLKVRGKICFQRNYWKAVLVALVIALAGGMQGQQVIRSLSMMMLNGRIEIPFPDSIKNGQNNNPYNSPGNSFGNQYNDDFNFYFDSNGNAYSGGTNPFSDFIGSPTAAAVGLALVIFSLLLFLFFFIMIVAVLLDVFIKNPLFIGTQRFFIHNLTADGMVGDMGFGFDRSYKNQVKVMFFRDLYTLGWLLLFIIPGWIKSYEYRMIPYLMAEYPQMDKEQAFYTSRYLMHGNKWKAFLLDLSFIGWWFLSTITLGLVGLFFVNPYYASTCSALYEALKAIKGIPDYNPHNPSRYEQPISESNNQNIWEETNGSENIETEMETTAVTEGELDRTKSGLLEEETSSDQEQENESEQKTL